ncbi:hypothetical protein [Fusobacterium hominis]|uniref:hypothetical protein n=1 Tax=Fusobacterium hominis TaxID=2764326 RepID=UPI0022E8181F|nr:hypothetical protein [Fusobacterium hominis]
MVNIYKFIDEKEVDMENIGYIKEDLELFLKNPTEYFPEWDSRIMRVEEENYEFPRWDNERQVVRMKTREEFVSEDGRLDYLVDGERFQDGRIVKVPDPSTQYLKYKWNRETFQWELTTTKEELQATKTKLILKHNEKRKEIEALNEESEYFDVSESVTKANDELEEIRAKINEIDKVIEEMNKQQEVII